jgi:hypothetical protein
MAHSFYGVESVRSLEFEEERGHALETLRQLLGLETSPVGGNIDRRSH